MINPFIYGKAVSKPQFINREEEIGRLTTILQGHTNVLLLGDRRMGKTSLILLVLERLKRKGYPCFYLNLDPIEDIDIFIERFSSLFTTHRTFGNKAAEFISKTVRSLGLTATINDNGKPVLKTNWTKSIAQAPTDIAQVFSIPQKLAHKHKYPFIIAIDEFQMINKIKIKGIDLLGELRTQVMRSPDVNYLFLGSEITTLEQLFSSSTEKFFSSVHQEFLGYIDRSHFIQYIQTAFHKRKVETSADVVNFICEWSRDIPATIQQLAAATWDFLPKNVSTLSPEVITAIINEEVARKEIYFIQLWKSLVSLDQRILQGIAKSEPCRHNTIEFYTPLGVDRSTVSRHVSDLSKGTKGFILYQRSEGVFFCDPFFREWVKTTI